MIKLIKHKSLQLSAMVTVGIMAGSQNAFAETDFSDVTDSLESSLGTVPTLISGASYILGTLLGVLGILKIKDHVEQPTSVKLQEGAIRLAAGGGLLALPFIQDVMVNNLGGETDTEFVRAQVDAW
jgi:hypothetical protein